MMTISTYSKDPNTSLNHENNKSSFGIGHWSRVEHERFLEALRIYPKGSWKTIAEYVGTRTIRQTMTHAQKLRQKTRRCLRALEVEKHMSYRHPMSYDPREFALREQLRLLSRNVTLKNNSGILASGALLHHSRPSFIAHQDPSTPTDPSMLTLGTDTFHFDDIKDPSSTYTKNGVLHYEQGRPALSTLSDCSSLEPIVSAFDELSGPTLEECASALLDIFSFKI